MSITSWWWIACIALIGAELVSGTFYLLMAALGLAAAALLSYADTTLTQQVTTAAIVSGGAVAIWHLMRSRSQTEVDLVASDVGQTVQVNNWQENGNTSVQYRGANWAATLANPQAERTTGPHRIVAVDGTRLRIEAI